MKPARDRSIVITGIIWILIAIAGCQKDTIPLQGKSDLNITYPDYFPEPVYRFNHNAFGKDGYELGKKLFFDTRLSLDNTISCASCHQPSAAFADAGKSISRGINNHMGIRNSQPLFNLIWNKAFFWDGGVNHIEMQPINPINHPDEMGNTLANLVQTLNQVPDYKPLFRKAFNKDSVDSEGIFKALAQYMSFLISDQSKYDKVKQKTDGTVFTTQEARGYLVFKQHCNSCHTEPLFTDHSYRNNGIDIIPNSKNEIDLGRGVIDHLDSSTYYTFRVPTLRNLKYTAPYMHDGRFNSLEDVLQHYTTGIQHTPNLDAGLQHNIMMSETDKANLLQFLHTLNDESFIKNSIYTEQ